MNCTNVPVTLARPRFVSTDETRLADFTSPPQDCLPPCWYSFTPGDSKPDEITPFFARLGVEAADVDTHASELSSLSLSSAYFEDFPHRFPYLPPRVSVLWSPSNVASVALQGLNPDFIGPSDIVSSLGTPEDIILWIDSHIELRYFTLILRYPQLHTSVFVSGILVSNNDQTDELLCLNDKAGISTDVLFYADSLDPYAELSLLEDYPITSEFIEEEVQYEWRSLSKDPPFALSLHEAAELIAREGACFPPMK
ncbi:MAG: hypothetical protein WBZ24_07100 [Anaerolineales bacterium]